tara:strand:- start:21 stop:134 length:114 start_codon:yes stop_codon:yes gene_type:complete
MGLIEPEADVEQAVEVWYLGSHVEDAYHCPTGPAQVD